MRSIRTRLVLWLMIPLTLVAAVVALETFSRAQRVSNDLYDRTLLAVMLTVSEHVVATNGDVLTENLLEVLTDSLGDQFFYHVAGPGKSFVTGYSGFPKPPAGIELEGGKPVFYDGIYQGDPVRVVAMRQLLSQRELNGWTNITAWQRVGVRTDLTYSMFGRSLTRFVLLILSAGLIVWFAVAFGLRPLRNLQHAIESRTPYDLTPIRRAMPVELSGIVKSMNDLFARVARSKANRERFIGDAAHQLRNPIAALKVQAETSLDAKSQKRLREGLEQIVDTTNKTGRIIEQMLASASAHATDPDSGEEFDLAETVREAARTCAPSALRKNQDLSLDCAFDHCLFNGHRILMQEAVVNLIDNAIRHTDEGSAINVSLHGCDDGEHLCINVSDQGAPFTEEDLLRHSQPFATGGGPRSGSGLGLSIAKDVAKSHGGYLAVSPGDNGSGKSITILLPRPT